MFPGTQPCTNHCGGAPAVREGGTGSACSVCTMLLCILGAEGGAHSRAVRRQPSRASEHRPVQFQGRSSSSCNNNNNNNPRTIFIVH